MIISPDALRKDLVALIKVVEAQITVVEQTAKAQGVDPTVLQNQDGSWPLIPLLTAKAQAYNSLVLLQTSEPRAHQPRMGRPR
jgi:hypothetical protein